MPLHYSNDILPSLLHTILFLDLFIVVSKTTFPPHSLATYFSVSKVLVASNSLPSNRCLSNRCYHFSCILYNNFGYCPFQRYQPDDFLYFSSLAHRLLQDIIFPLLKLQQIHFSAKLKIKISSNKGRVSFKGPYLKYFLRIFIATD